MGNPTANSLPACQINKVASLVSQLQTTASAGKDSSPSTDKFDINYRVWIDPLLCPIEAEGKKLSLQRIPDVYRNATHVLVLDASLMEYSAEDLPPEEILLRIFSSSAWMRRLWTLQGTLCSSCTCISMFSLTTMCRGCPCTITLFSVRRLCCHANGRNDQALYERLSRCTVYANLAGHCH